LIRTSEQRVYKLKNLIRRHMPDHHRVRNHRFLRFFGTLLHDPNLWHLNRRSAAGGASIGLFMAFVPVPFQMVLAAAVAIPMRVNLPISIGLVWVTNPLTMPALYYASYKVGTWLLGAREVRFRFEPSLDWLMTEMVIIWKPFLLGCFVLGTLSAIAGYTLVRLLWRLHVVRHVRDKRHRINLRTITKPAEERDSAR
jgi:uncharacterized protein